MKPFHYVYFLGLVFFSATSIAAAPKAVKIECRVSNTYAPALSQYTTITSKLNAANMMAQMTPMNIDYYQSEIASLKNQLANDPENAASYNQQINAMDIELAKIKAELNDQLNDIDQYIAQQASAKQAFDAASKSDVATIKPGERVALILKMDATGFVAPKKPNDFIMGTVTGSGQIKFGAIKIPWTIKGANYTFPITKDISVYKVIFAKAPKLASGGSANVAFTFNGGALGKGACSKSIKIN